MSESTLSSSLNVKKSPSSKQAGLLSFKWLQWNFSLQNHFVHKETLNHLAKLANLLIFFAYFIKWNSVKKFCKYQLAQKKTFTFVLDLRALIFSKACESRTCSITFFPVRTNVNLQPWYFYFLISGFYRRFPFLYKKKLSRQLSAELAVFTILLCQVAKSLTLIFIICSFTLIPSPPMTFFSTFLFNLPHEILLVF